MRLHTRVSRMFDDKPYAAHLYLTDRCNLECAYCNEYDNEAPHPETEKLKAWMRKLQELGVGRLNFLGGEPLLHPDVVELVRHARSLGYFRVGMSTNGLLLTQDLLRRLEEAGLGSIQISVDRMTPTASTRKSLKSIRHKLAWFADSKVSVTVSGVITEDTVDELRQVIDECLERGIPVAARPIHDDLVNRRDLRGRVAQSAVLDLVDY